MTQSTIEISGNAPIRLDVPDCPYVITDGRADVFLVEMVDGEPGRRIFMLHVETGGLLFGIPANAIPGFTLMAYGCGNAVLKTTEIKDPRHGADVHDWVDGLTAQLAARQVPPASHTVFSGEDVTLEPGTALRGGSVLRWATVIEGATNFLDITPVTVGQLVPLSGKGWITAPEGATIRAGGEAASIQEIVAFTELAAQQVKAASDAQGVFDREIYTAGRKHEASAMRRALVKLKSILNADVDADAIDYAGYPPLFAACAVVADAGGMTLTKMKFKAGDQEPELEDIARLSGFRFRRVVLEGKWWLSDSGPLLGCLDSEDKPIALLSDKPGTYVAVDPATGSRTVVDEAFAKNILRTAYMFYRPFPDRKLSPRDVLNFSMFRSGRDLLTLLILGSFGGLLGLLTPIATSQLLGTFIPEASRSGILQMAFVLAGAAFAIAGFDVLKGMSMVRLEGRMDLHVQAAAWDRLLSLPVPFFRNFTAGDLAIRSMGFASMRQILSGVTINAFLTMIFSSFNLFWLFYYDWEMALVAIGLTLVGCIVTAVCGILIVLYQKDILNIQGRLSGLVLQFITGINKLRLTGSEDRAFSVWAEGYFEQKDCNFKAGKITALLGSFNGLFPALTTAFLFGWFFWVRRDSMSVADFVAFNTAFTTFLTAFLQISNVLTNTAYLIPLYQRAAPILEELPEFNEAKESPGQLAGDLVVSHASFRYAPDAPLILRDLNLEARRGEFVAIVGGSGAGKSTMLRVLLGFEQLESGAVFYDDQELKNLDVREVRRQIGVVLQNGKVMAGDIFTNIVGTSNLSMDDAWEAARMVGLADDIEAMPMKMNTMVPAGGGTLSGGQCQRLLIARAIVRRPRILFFDEATSALDNKTQAQVSRSLEELKVTRVVIAHRLSTIMGADRIYAIERGRVIESGTYDELMAAKGFFHELAQRQIA